MDNPYFPLSVEAFAPRDQSKVRDAALRGRAVIRAEVPNLLPGVPDGALEPALYGYSPKHVLDDNDLRRPGGVMQVLRPDIMQGSIDDMSSMGFPSRGLRVNRYEKDDKAGNALADAIESRLGTYERYPARPGDPQIARPSWSNSVEFAKAGAQYAENSARSGSGIEDAYLESQFLMHPERYKYMQKTGRVVDLLRNLHRDPSLAMHYWDRSNLARTTRLDPDEAHYQRFSGAENLMGLFTNPTSTIGSYLRSANLMPQIASYAAETGGAPVSLGDDLGYAYGESFWPGSKLPEKPVNLSDAAYLSAALADLNANTQLGENPVLDMPSLPERPTIDQVARHNREYTARMAELAEQVEGLKPPSGRYIGSKLYGQNVPQATADLLDFYLGVLDPSLVAGLGAGAAGRYLQRPSLLRALTGEARDQLVPEVAISGPIMATVMQEPKRTFTDYALKPAVPEVIDHDARMRLADKVAAEQRGGVPIARARYLYAPKSLLSGLEGFSPTY